MAATYALTSDPDIISFDDDLLSFAPSSTSSPPLPPSSEAGSQDKSALALHVSDPSLMEWGQAVIALERDGTHFEVLPRVLIASVLPLDPSGSGLGGAVGGVGGGTHHPMVPSSLPMSVGQAEASARLVHFSRSGSLLFTAGHVDGSVMVREIDGRTGFVVSAGDFLGHRRRVLCLSSDFISGSQTDVIASCDAYGQILVWTVSMSTVVSSTGGAAAGRTYIISRRPQRMFRTKACVHSCLDVSWSMGVVAAAAGGCVRLFSM